MKNQKLAVLSLALLVGAIVASLFATTAYAQSNSGRASGFGKAIPVYWEGGSLTTDLTDEADTTRTMNISTRDWDWGTVMNGTGTGTAALAIAKVVFQASTTNWAGDSIYFAVEASVDGGTTYTRVGGLLGGEVTATPAVGNCAVLTPANQTTPAQWCGLLVFDRDANPNSVLPSNNIIGVNDFRLKIYGDVGGTTPTYTGLTCTIYPLRTY